MYLRSLVIPLIILSAACTFERTVKLDARLPMPPAVDQMPLRIGVYYSPQFIQYTKKIDVRKLNLSLIFPVGITSKDLFDQITNSMFATVIKTSVLLPPSDDTSSIDGFLEPRIESFQSSVDFSSWPVKYMSKVNYTINFYDGFDGHLVTSMLFEGWGFCLRSGYSYAAEMAMQDAMAQFMIDFPENLEIKLWLLNHSAGFNK